MSESENKLDSIPSKYYNESSIISSSNITSKITLNRTCCKNDLGCVISFRYNLNIRRLHKNELKQHFYLFKTKGISWRLCIFPHGVNERNTEYMSVYLVATFEDGFKNKTADAHFSFDYGLEESYCYKFTSKENSRGLIRWKRRHLTDKINVSGHFVLMYTLSRTCLSIKCEDSNLICLKDKDQRIPDVMFKKPFDVKLKGDNWIYYFHSELLVFKSSFIKPATPRTRDSSSSEVRTVNVPFVSRELMEVILQYLHLGKIRLDRDLLTELCSVAVDYNIHDLKMACEFELLCFMLKENTASQNWIFASSCSMKLLQKKCLEMCIPKNFYSIKKSSEWVEIVRNPQLVLDLTRRLASTSNYIVNADIDKNLQRCPNDKLTVPSIDIRNCSKTCLYTLNEFKQDIDKSIVKLEFKVVIDQSNISQCFSHKFSSNKCNWELKIWTDGVNDESKGFISIYFFNNDVSHENVVVGVDFSFDYEQDYVHYHFFKTSDNGRGLSKWRRNNVLENDILTVRFIMRFREWRSETSTSSEDINRHIFYHTFEETSLLNKMVPYDTLLVGKDWEFNVHREILAAHSPAFAAMFVHEIKENIENKVCIKDIEYDTAKQLISFMYTGRITVNRETAIKLCITADKYLMDTLKFACEHEISYRINIENVIDSFIIASVHRFNIIKSNCIHLIRLYFKAVTQTEDWVRLANQADMINNLMEELLKSGKFKEI